MKGETSPLTLHPSSNTSRTRSGSTSCCWSTASRWWSARPKRRRIKIICRYQQYEGANLMVARVVKGYPKKGLIWHFQGSGKSLLMVFAAQKLRMHRKLGNPTVMIVVDRIDLDTQITATFNAADIPNMIGAATRQELQNLLTADTRG